MEPYRMIGSTDVAGFLSAFLSFVKQLILYISVSVKKYFLLAVFIFSAISALGFVYWFVQKPYYETEMVCAFNNLTKKVYGEMLLKLDLLLQSGSYPALAQILQLPLSQVQQLVSIQAKNIAGSPLHEDVTTDQSPMYISVKTTDKDILKSLQFALINYLNSSPYRQRRNQMELEIIGTKLKFLNRDMYQADSVISAYTNFLKRTRSVTDTAAGFSNIAAMMTYKNELEDKQVQQEWRLMELESSVEVLHGFMVPDYPLKKRNILWQIIPLALLLSIIIPVFLNLLLTPQPAKSDQNETNITLEPEPVAAGS